MAKGPEVKTPSNVPVDQRDEVKVPSHVYLLPREKKSPYKRYRGGEWVISCADLRDAIRLAAMHGYKSVEEKARQIYAKECKGE